MGPLRSSIYLLGKNKNGPYCIRLFFYRVVIKMGPELLMGMKCIKLFVVE